MIVIARGRLVADETLEEATRAGSLEERFLQLTADPEPLSAREAER